MKKIKILRNPIQEYAWGSQTFISELLGNKTSDRPQAELWMGAHPKAPSLVKFQKKWISLKDIIDSEPQKILGEKVSKKFNKRLPYLFKVLAAASPLSIQAHPDKNQAVKGYERENNLRISFNAPERNYKDDSHKPECICAITPFWALNGFRDIQEILSLTRKACPSGLKHLIDDLEKAPDSKGLKLFFQRLMNMDEKQRIQVINETLKNAKKYSKDSSVFEWIIKLHKAYPSDIGVLSPLFLNLICLKPGQAMFIPAGELHSYLDGAGLELMANSDNVLRGGLTPKHVDVPELLQVLNFKPKTVEILSPEKISAYEWEYPGGAEEFVLSLISMPKDMETGLFVNNSVQILLCTQGSAVFSIPETNESVNVRKGYSLLITADINEYQIQGKAVFYKASVPV